jgi:MFS family permease
MMYGSSSVLWKEKYLLTPAGIGNIFGFIGICGAIVQGGLIGVFTKRVGVRRMLLWGCPAIAMGLMIIPLPEAGTAFYVVQAISIVLLSLGNGLMMPAINSLVSRNTPPESQGRMLGLLQSTSSLARAFGPFIAMVFYHQFSSLPYLVGGGLMVVAFFLSLILSKTLRVSDPDPVAKPSKG